MVQGGFAISKKEGSILLCRKKNSERLTSIEKRIAQLEECYKITLLMDRFSKFITSVDDVTFERITLSENEFVTAHFYCKYVSNNVSQNLDVMF